LNEIPPNPAAGARHFTREGRPAGRPYKWLFAALVLVVGLLVWLGVGGPNIIFKEPEGCAACHVMRPYVEGFVSGRELDAAHARAGLTCTDCHRGHSFASRAKTAVAYLIGAAGRPPHPALSINGGGAPSKRRESDAMCTRCHVSMEHQAERTDFLVRNPHRSHWPELGCADCHPGHSRQIDFCGGCHDNGGQRMTGDPIITPRAENPWAVP